MALLHSIGFSKVNIQHNVLFFIEKKEYNILLQNFLQQDILFPHFVLFNSMLINRCKTLKQKEKTKTTWVENYQRLVEYQKKHGTFFVQFDVCDQDQYCFERWVDTQRISTNIKYYRRNEWTSFIPLVFPRQMLYR